MLLMQKRISDRITLVAIEHGIDNIFIIRLSEPVDIELHRVLLYWLGTTFHSNLIRNILRPN